MLVLVIELVVLALIVLFVVTQILIPAVQSRLMFPMFRKTAELECELNTTNQELYDVHLANEVNKAHDAVEAEKAKAKKS
jgi:hypothetical protein